MVQTNKSDLPTDELEIVGLSGAAKGVRVALDPDEQLHFGRGRRGVELIDNTVSLHHAIIAWTDEGYVIADLASATGTRVGEVTLNGQELLLEEGDEFQIGESVFRVQELHATWNRAARWASVAAVGLLGVGLFGFIVAPRANRQLVLSWHSPIHQGSHVSEKLQLNPAFLRMRGIDSNDLSIRRVQDADGDGRSEVWLRFEEHEQVVTFDATGGWIDRGVVPKDCLDHPALGDALPTLSCRGVTWAVLGETYAAVEHEGLVLWGNATGAERRGQHTWRVHLRKKRTLAGFLAAAGIDRPVHYVLCEGALPGVAAQAILEDGRVAPLNRSCRDALKISGLELDSVWALAFTATGHRALLRDLEMFYSGNVDGVFRPAEADQTVADWKRPPGTVIATAYVRFDEAEHFFNPVAAEGGLNRRRIWLVHGVAPAPLSTTATLMRAGAVRLDPPGCALLEVEVSEWTCPLAQGCLPGSSFITIRDQGCGTGEIVAEMDYKGGVVSRQIGGLDLRLSARTTGGLERRDVIEAKVAWRHATANP